ncbi:BREX system ATP-binding protein BrxD [Frankia sp. Cas3]|uniref:BREX system ATP-binding protein BrxD n=1 Tax=Frankia sp. Cas3 TaxID=3073926 RepID=UPI002AD46EA3|nr:BREX system ATP-binding protein BrxD [Frankia sp. Cas3]
MTISEQRRQEVIDALRRGTVPQQGLDALAVGLDRFSSAIGADFDRLVRGQATFKAIRGEYGAGKTFFTRWLAEQGKRRGFATAEIQISENETPLHRLETVYRRLAERLSTAEFAPSALRPVVDSWIFALEEDVLAGGDVGEDELARGVEDLLEQRLAALGRVAPSFSAALRAYRRAVAAGETAVAEGLIAWLGGQPHVAGAVKRAAGVRGDLDHDGALGFLQGLLAVLTDSGHTGLVVILDEVETLQRVRGDIRDKALNALRQLIDDVDAGRFPGLMLAITGTPAFFDGPQGAQRLAPLAQRLHVDFLPDPAYDNPRAVQLRLPSFTQASLAELGGRIRDLYAAGCAEPRRIDAAVDGGYITALADTVAGQFGGRVGVAPRIFVKKLVDVLDRVDQFPTFDPRRDYVVRLAAGELTDTERAAMPTPPQPPPATSVDDIDLRL